MSAIPAGTQVVVLSVVSSHTGRVVYPRGRVGVVTRTPAGRDEMLYLVRFPDGFESSFPREQLDVLKSFKARLGCERTTDPALAGFELEAHIVYRCVTGSRAYGLDTDKSDTDVRGVYIAPAKLHWSLHGAPEQFEDNAAQTCYWEFQKFIVMALRANPNILECLYSPIIEKRSEIGDELLGMRERFLSKMIFQTFNGYALSQFRKIEQDLRNQGKVRWKHAMHLVRLLITGAASLREERIPVRVEGTGNT